MMTLAEAVQMNGRVVIPLGDVRIDRLFELTDAVRSGAFDPWMAFQPGLDLGMPVRGVVVEDEVQIEFGIGLLLDVTEERRNS